MSRKDDTKAKQSYLITEIIQKGYNAEEFTNYIGSLRENGRQI